MLTADYWDRNTDSPSSQPTVLPYTESFLAGYEEDRTETLSYHGTFGISNSRWNDFSIPPTINLPESNVKMSRLVEIGMRLISRLEKFSAMQSLVEDYLNNSQAAPIAAPLVLGALSDLRKFLDCDGEANGDKYALCLKITENTCRPFEIPANISAQQFHTLFTGDNLRWEFIGLAFTWMALSVLRSQGDLFSQNRDLSNTSSLPETMAECSNSCISLCQNIGPPNDVMIWLLYDNLVLSTQLNGDFSKLIPKAVRGLMMLMVTFRLLYLATAGGSVSCSLRRWSPSRRKESLGTFNGTSILPPAVQEKSFCRHLPN
jgi:hypothetical protein